MDAEITITGSHEEDRQENQKSLGQKVPKFHEMPNSQRLLWGFLIGILFLCWISLVFFGLSFNSTKYHDIVFGIDLVTNPDPKALPHIMVKAVLGKPTLGNLIIYTLSFTPINVAIVAAVSALIGGLVSNLVAANKYAHEWRTHIKPSSEEFHIYMFMTEHPLVAMIRGFVVYLLVLTGASLTNFTSAVDQTKEFSFAGSSAPVYLKFCVTVSLLSYLVGYDPSRLKNILSGINVPKKEDDSLAQTNGKLLDVINRLDIRLRNEPEKNHQSSHATHQPRSNKQTDLIKESNNNFKIDGNTGDKTETISIA